MLNFDADVKKTTTRHAGSCIAPGGCVTCCVNVVFCEKKYVSSWGSDRKNELTMCKVQNTTKVEGGG